MSRTGLTEAHDGNFWFLGLVTSLQEAHAVTTKGITAPEGVEAANPQLGAIITLPDFLATAGALTPAQRRTIVGQALTLIDDLYVHLPLKRAMHAVDPVQRLKLLRRRLASVTERDFHDEMISIFGSSHKCVHDSAPAGRPRRGKRVRMRSCQLTSGEVVCRSVDGRLRGPRF